MFYVFGERKLYRKPNKQTFMHYIFLCEMPWFHIDICSFFKEIRVNGFINFTYTCSEEVEVQNNRNAQKHISKEEGCLMHVL